MLAEAAAGLIGMNLMENLKEPAKKAFGWLFEKSRNKYDEHKLEQALDNLSDKITKVTRVKTIYKGDDSIDLHEFYVPTRIEDIDVSINFVTDVSKQSIVLQGTVGQGKSIFMRYLTYQEAKHGQRIPLFYELRRLDDSQTLTNALSQQISNWITEFKETDFDRVAKTGKLVLFLDGFDEVPHDKVKKLLNEIEGWCERYPNMQIIVSSRPETDIKHSNYFKVFKLFEYRFYEQSLLIDKLVVECESNKLLKKAIEDSDTEIQELIKTPLMVTLFIMNYRGSLEIPSNQYEFYKNLFSVLITRHDKTKPGYERELNSSLSKKELQEIFEQFCFISLNADKLVFSYTDAIEIINKCLERQNLKTNCEAVLSDFSKIVCLLINDGMEYAFVHKSIQEYYYASYITRKSETAKKGFYTKCLEVREIFEQLHSVFSFLKISDEYSFKKYIILPRVERIIKTLEISNEYNLIFHKLCIHRNIIQQWSGSETGLLENEKADFFDFHITFQLDSWHFLICRFEFEQGFHLEMMYEISDFLLTSNPEVILYIKDTLKEEPLMKFKHKTDKIGELLILEQQVTEKFISYIDNVDLDF